jgi:DNA polymerase I
MQRYVLDIEANGLLDEATEIYVAVVIDTESNKTLIFCDYPTPDTDTLDLMMLTPFLDGADEIITQNGIDYDLPLLKKLLGWVPPKRIKLLDTLIISMVMDYKRFGFGHSLEKWAEYFNRIKPPISSWVKFDPAMIHRCIEDTELTLLTFNKLVKEVKIAATSKPIIKTSLRAEHATATFIAKAKERGWRINVAELKELTEKLSARNKEISDILSPKLPSRIKKTSKVRSPIYNKSGVYSVITAKAFEIEPTRGLSDRPVDGPFSMLERYPPDIDSIDCLKKYLYSIGWKPIEWNMKKINNKWERTTPKLCTTSLCELGTDGELIDEYLTNRSRLSIIEGWKSLIDKDDRLHGEAFSIGTPTFRCRHSIIVNIPSVGSSWGAEMRNIFVTDPGNVIVGGDSSGNQARALCHYINDDEFTRLCLEEDLHAKNAITLTTPRSAVSRSTAKRWYYAWLFGAGAAKLSRYIIGYEDVGFGRELSDLFLTANPKLKRLIEKLEEVFELTLKKSNGTRGYIPALDGRRVYSDSKHKLLNYTLQSFEAITCKAALLYFNTKMEEEGIPYFPLIFMHDELQVEVAKEHAERTAIIMKEAFREAPKWYGVNIMDGESKIGNTWFETH